MLVRLTGVAIALVAILGLGANVYAYSFVSNLPNVRGMDAATLQGDTIIKDRNGEVLADLGKDGDRRIAVTLDQMSPKLRQATVSIEDRTFWTNQGFEPEAILRTAANNFRAGGIAGGGSTITQQLAKQLFLTPEQSLDRKVKELVLAYQLNQTYSKRQILELYLNRSYYGEQQYGVQAAARTYFLRDARDLDLAQSALISGLPQAPDTYDPVRNLDAAKHRQKEVLDAMVRDGSATPQEAAAAYAEHLDVHAPVNNYKARQFVDYVLTELRAHNFNPGQQQLVVTTTVDWAKQQFAEQVVRENLQANLYKDKVGVLSSALVSMDPKTGQIVTYVGSPGRKDVKGDNYDYVGVHAVNPGSSVKPFTYGKAILDRKITVDTQILDGPTPYVLNLPGEKYKVENYDRRSHGVLPAKKALGNSLNIPAVKVEWTVGMPAIVDFYRQMGMRPRSGDNPDGSVNSYGPSLTLGGYPITLLEEVSALSTYADMGYYHQPEAILQVSDPKGTVLYQADPNQGKRLAVDPGVAYIMASIMSDNDNRLISFGPNSPLHLPDRRAAAKTGTSENFHDGLTIGFTPDLATVVWMGDTAGGAENGYHLYGSQADGVFVAAPAWHRYMEGALKGVPDKWYDMPANVVKQGNSYFLSDTPKVDRLGMDPAPTPSPGTDAGVPADPGSGPQPVNGINPRFCRGPIPLPGCPPPIGGGPGGGPPGIGQPPGGGGFGG